MMRTVLCSLALGLVAPCAKAQGSFEPLPFAVTDSAMHQAAHLDTVQFMELLRLIEGLPKREYVYSNASPHDLEYGICVEGDNSTTAQDLCDVNALVVALEDALRLARKLACQRAWPSPNPQRP